jgi:energy-coupling factor transporter transmembrane protein EcfT
MHFLGHLVLALAIIIAAMIVAFAFRFTPVVAREFIGVGDAQADHVHSFDHWTGNTK